jgi:hypothetical protein
MRYLVTTTKLDEADGVAPPRLSGVKVFSATMQQDRNRLGETVTAWLAEHPMVKILETIVTQSSDSAFHCIAITIFYDE